MGYTGKARGAEGYEIMAPAGSPESLSAAIKAGADSVYFGVGDLNMRSRSGVNFTIDDLSEIASRCGESGVKTYLTLNTIIYDTDIAQMELLLMKARDAGITAVIASDIAAIEAARRHGLGVHISTQANVSNTSAVRYYARYADVMVLARELTLEQVGAIHRAIEREPITGPSGNPVRLEMFCHGALCMAISGKCYLSLHEMGSSANRGACGQICRRGYTVEDRETGRRLDIEGKYIMSPKDLKTVHFLDRMVGAGVKVFKIEGRARGPEYVSETVGVYREALDAVLDGRYGSGQVSEWDERLGRVFNRGFWDGYYLGQRLGEWSEKYGSSATRTKSYCAKTIRWFSRLGVGEFQMEAGELKVGDEVVITGPTTGAEIFVVEELRVDLERVSRVVKGDRFSMPVPSKVRPSDRLYRWDART